jgi:membrane-associated phospholipid phosphatase
LIIIWLLLPNTILMTKKLTSIILLFLFINHFANAQDKVITGHITDNIGKPVNGATIIAQPSGRGTASTADGSFRLSAANTDKAIKITLVGYETYIQPITGSHKFDIALQPSSGNVLNEVVLVGTRSVGRTRLNTTAPVDVFDIAKGSALLSTAVKGITQRERPYLAHPDMITGKQSPTDYSFPSGHVSVSFATATSLSLAIPKWYVIVPSYAYVNPNLISLI